MLTILVVDDDHQIRAWIRQILESNGYHLEVAGRREGSIGRLPRMG